MFRFSMRELLVFTALAAVAVAWWIDRNRIARLAEERDLWTFRAESVAEVIRRDGGQVDWNDDEITVSRTDSAGLRRMIMIPRKPYQTAPALALAPPGAPMPVRIIRRDSSNRVKK
jgi:hypothetical protein